MEINVQKENGQMLVALTGRLDSVSAPELEEKLTDLEDVTDLQFDFEQLEYLSSAGLRVLLQASKIMKKQGNMVIRHVNASVREVFVITGFAELIRIED